MLQPLLAVIGSGGWTECNLTRNERALIAARMAGLANGSNQHIRRDAKEGELQSSPSISLAQAAMLMGEDDFLAEFDFRYNKRVKLGVGDAERAERALRGVVGKRLTYRSPHQQAFKALTN